MKGIMKKIFAALVIFTAGWTFMSCEIGRDVLNKLSAGVVAISDPTNNQLVYINGHVSGTCYDEAGVSAVLIKASVIYGGPTNVFPTTVYSGTLSTFEGDIAISNGGYYYLWAEAINTQNEFAYSPKVFVYVVQMYLTNTNDYDEAAPVVTITSPTNNQIVGNAITASGIAADNKSGIKTVYLKLDSAGFTPVSVAGSAWSTNIALTVTGAHTIRVYGIDMSNNISATNMVTVNYIAGNPSVTITSPVSGIATNLTSINIAGTAAVSGYTITSVKLKVNASGFNSVGNTAWNTNGVLLTEGTNSFTALAIASSGKSNTSPVVKILRDTAKPTASFTYPSGGATVAAASFTITGSASDGAIGSGISKVYLAVNSGFVPVTGTASWNKLVTLPDGAYTLYVYSVDKVGLVSSTNQISITVAAPDTTRPEISITAPVNNISTTNASIDVSGTASDNKAVTTVYVAVNTGAFAAATGTVSWSKNAALDLGTNTIKAYSQDAAGNKSATNSVKVIKNNSGTGMTVYFKKPSVWAGAYIHYWPTGSVWASCPAMTSIGNGWYSYYMNDRTSTSCLFKNVSGTNVLYQTADLQRTGDGWYWTNNQWYDSNPEDVSTPTVNITSPTDYREVTSDTLNIMGTAAGGGLTGVYIKVNAGGFVLATGTLSWIKSVSLDMGTNTIEVYAQGSSQQSTHKYVHVVRKTGSGSDWPGSYTGKLGANLFNDGVEFSIWWKDAVVSAVYVTGDFNGWGQTPLTRITSGANTDVWWAFIPGVSAGSEYKFIGIKRVEGSTPVADPYSKYNRYSSGSSVVCDQTYAWTDGSWNRPGWDYYIVYELHPKDFTSADSTVPAAHKGKYLGIVDKLTYLTNLGITAVELMPPSEFPDAGYSWGYNTSLYMSVESGYAQNPSQGQDGLNEFKQMVNACHQYGVAVIIDMVFNHTANNDNWLWTIDSASYFSGTTPWGNKLYTAADIVKRLGKDTIEYFMNECHVDGFRYDATHTDFMDHGFIRDLKSYAMAIDPNVYFVYENLPNQTDLKTWGAQWSDGYHDNGVNALCGWNGANANTMTKYIFYGKDDGWAGSPVEALNYVESHDEDTLGRLFGFAGYDEGTKKARTRLAVVMLATSLGNPMIWMGQEFLRVREGQDIDELALDWSGYTTYNDIYQYYAGILKLRKNNPALRQPTETYFAFQYKPWEAGKDTMVVGYSLSSPTPTDDIFVVLLNFDRYNSKTVWVGFPENGTWKKVASETQVDPNGISGQDISVTANGANITVGASAGVIYMKVR